MVSATEKVAPGKREQNRNARRSSILDAARRILTSGGAEALVIRRLADMAKTTPRTIYAIFGSKEGVLLALYLDVSDLPLAFSNAKSKTLAQILANFGSAMDRITAEASLMRPLIYALQYAGLTSERVTMEDDVAEALSRSLEICRLRGELEDLVAPRMLARQIVLTFVQGLRRWSQQKVPDGSLCPDTLFGITLLMMGAATPGCRRQLQLHLKARQAEMVQYDLT